MFLNILIINIHYHLPNKEVPQWLRTFAFNRLACGLCCMNYKESDFTSFQVCKFNFFLLFYDNHFRNTLLFKNNISMKLAQGLGQ